MGRNWYSFWKSDEYAADHSRRASDLQTRNPSQAPTIPSRDLSNPFVSAGEALGLSSVFRAVQLIALSAKQISIDTYRNGQIVPSPGFIKRPDINESRVAFVEQTVNSLSLNGNAYWKIDRDDQNRVTNLEVLNPLDVVIDGKVYKYHGKVYKADKIQHLKFLRIPGSPKGLGPIQAAQHELRSALDIRDYAANWFTKSGVPNGYLAADQPMPLEDLQAMKTQWIEAVKGHQVAATANGLEYKLLGLSPKDALFIETQSFSVTQVSRMFGIPQRYMMASIEGSSLTYANMNDERRQFVESGLMAYLVEIEDAFSQLLPGTQYAKFNVEAFLRTDTRARYEAHKLALDGGWLTVDEVRAIENLEPLGGNQQGKEDDPTT